MLRSVRRSRRGGRDRGRRPRGRGRSLDALVALTARSSRPHERPGAHRRRHARRGRPPPRARAARPAGGGDRRRGPRARPFSEALPRPGISLIAEHKRRSPSAGVIREGATVDRDRAGLRARRRGRAVDPHRAVPLRRLARRPARGARGDRAAGPAQGLHRRPLPALRVGGRGRRRDPADRRRARPRRPLRPAARGARRSTSTRSSRSTTSASSTSRSTSRPTCSASTTAT